MTKKVSNKPTKKASNKPIKKVNIGIVGVDTGLLIIADPANLLFNEISKNFGKNWEEFCDIIHGDPKRDSMQFNFDHGHAGLAVVAPTAIGDGIYPVFYEEEDGVVKRLVIELGLYSEFQKANLTSRKIK